MIDPTNLGATGLLVYFVVKESYSFVMKSRVPEKVNGSSGKQSTDYWELHIKAIVHEEVKLLVESNAEIIRTQGRLMEALLRRK